jgi:hypothetical protein
LNHSNIRIHARYRGHAAQLRVDPALEPFVIVVDRLYVIDRVRTGTGMAFTVNRYGLNLNIELLLNGSKGATAIDAKQRIGCHHTAQRVDDFFLRELRQHVIRGVGLASHTQYEYGHRVRLRRLSFGGLHASPSAVAGLTFKGMPAFGVLACVILPIESWKGLHQYAFACHK